MFIIGYFLEAVATILDYVLLLYMLILIVRAILSWASPDPHNPIVRFVHNVTEPLLSRIRLRLPLSFGGLDLSPIIVIVIIIFLRVFVVQSLFRLAASFHQ